jgi:flagellar FliL protein
MADEKDIAEDAPQGGGKKKLIMLAGGAVLLLVIGAGAAVMLMGGGDDAAGEETAEEPIEQGELVYHKLDPTFVVSLAPGGPAKMLQLAVQIRTRQPDLIDTLKTNDPMIRHHLLNLFESQDAASLMTVQGKEALQQSIHDLLAERLEALNAPGKVHGVFFTQFVMQ